MEQKRPENPEWRIMRNLLSTADPQGTRFLVQTILQSADQEFKESGAKWYRGQYLIARLSEISQMDENSVGEYVAQYLDSESASMIGGKMTTLPSPDLATRNPEFPRFLTEVESRIGTFVMGYLLHRVGKQELPLTLTGKQFLGNTDEETMKLIRWMDDNTELVCDYYEWVELNPEDEIVKEFEAKQAEGTLRHIEDNGW